ncbi:putative CENPB DNA-binding domain-containing protein 1 [Saccopteryx leptura]|uniref:putative CENPB DNA-binding domain-containing protein 1 n=1 Tax=Saccopteryx leptura TaxID=249018 RepID=UPI00339C1BB4
MSTKRKLSLSMPQPAKKERKAIHLDMKMKVIKQYKGGKKVNVIARDTKLSHSSVLTILKERICEAVKGSAPMRSTVITKQRSRPIHEMEKLLYIWMEDQIQKRTPISLFTVQIDEDEKSISDSENACWRRLQSRICSKHWLVPEIQEKIPDA